MILKNKVVILEYTLKDDSGNLLDSSTEGEPLQYIHGTGDMLPGLEKALDGKCSGDNVRVTLPPGDGYGQREEDLVIKVERDQFEHPDQVELGTRIHLLTPEGSYAAEVLEVDGDEVTLDANHPLAGMTLQFDVSILEVRDPTPAELEAGRAAGEEDEPAPE
jgi:FKBP-type peptidyl-prolyl cis-trans isomerase SlyD